MFAGHLEFMRFSECSFAQMKISWNCSKRITQVGREVWKLQSFMLSIQFCKMCSSCVLVDVNIKSVFHGFWSIFRELLCRLHKAKTESTFPAKKQTSHGWFTSSPSDISRCPNKFQLPGSEYHRLWVSFRKHELKWIFNEVLMAFSLR